MADGRTLGAAVAAIPIALGLLANMGDDRNVGARVTARPAAATFESGPVVASATAKGFLNVYFGNLHSHTSYSDGVEEPDDAFRFARNEAALDFMALTEHNHSKAGKIATQNSLYSGAQANSLISTANRLTENGQFVALYGQEFSTIGSGNHINVLDVPRVIDVGNGEFGDLLNSWLPANPDTLGGMPVLLMNHPGTSDSPNEIEYGRDDFGSEVEWIRRMGSAVSLMAIVNGPSHEDGIGLPSARPAESEYLRYLNLGFRVAPTADQDNHKPNWGATTNARTAVIADDLSKASLLKAMKARHVYATEDKNLRVVCRVNGQLCGDHLTATPTVGAELGIELTIHDADEPSAMYEIDVFSDQVGGEVVRDPVEVVTTSGNTATPLKIEDIRYSGGTQFVFFRVRQLTEEDEDSDHAWTAPVWMGGTAVPVPTPTADQSQFVASRHSKIYHRDSACKSAQSIKAGNRVTGVEAKKGRTLHPNCPI